MERALSFRQNYAGVEPVRIGAPDAILAASPSSDTEPGTAGSGVTVHRGRTMPGVETAMSAPSVSSASTPRVHLASGVRIHIGSVHAGPVLGGGAPLPVVSISEESDPT